jgi:hypothetical protein
LIAGTCLTLAASAALGQSQRTFRARLVEGSTMLREVCLPPCACPAGATTFPLRGSFVFIPDTPTPWFQEYRVVHVHWSGSIVSRDLIALGDGHYRVGGDFAYTHQLSLDLLLNGAATETLDSGMTIAAGHTFPNFEITATTEQVICQRDTAHVVAVPTCFADLDNGSGLGASDGGVGIEDLLYFLSLYEAGSVEADVDDGSGTTALDGGVGIEDLLHYLRLFSVGC